MCDKLAMIAPSSARATPTVFILVKVSVRAATLNRYAKRAAEFEMMVLLVTLVLQKPGRVIIDRGGGGYGKESIRIA